MSDEKEIYRRVVDVAGDVSEDRVVVSNDLVEFHDSEGCCVFYHTDAIGAAKAILKHFGEECDAAKEMHGAVQSKDASIARLEAEVVLLRNQRNDLSDRISRVLEEKDDEIAHFRSKLADAVYRSGEVERHRDEARGEVETLRAHLKNVSEDLRLSEAVTNAYRVALADFASKADLAHPSIEPKDR